MKTIKISMSEFKDWVSIQQGEFTGFPKFALCDFLGIKRFGNSIEELEDFIPFGSMGIFYHIAKIDWYNQLTKKMGTKHTPAPWNIHFNETGHATSIRSDHHICVMRTNNLDECNANAKLIAAAPDLLEALEVCFASLCTYGQHPLIELRVKAAIKKATELP